MKKLVIVAAVALAAMFSKAATATWGFTGITAAGDTAAAAGWVGYLMAGSTWDAFSALDDSAKTAYVLANSLASATTVNARGSINLAGTGYGTFAAGDTFEAYSVIFAGSSAESAEYIAYSAVKSATVAASGANISIQDTFANLTSMTGASGGWASTAAVPEPTSGLLMLLGMAGLALRRRRA